MQDDAMADGREMLSSRRSDTQKSARDRKGDQSKKRTIEQSKGEDVSLNQVSQVHRRLGVEPEGTLLKKGRDGRKKGGCLRHTARLVQRQAMIFKKEKRYKNVQINTDTGTDSYIQTYSESGKIQVNRRGKR